MSPENRPPCEWPIDADGMVPFDIVAASAGTCSWPPEAKGFRFASTVVDKHGHKLDGDDDPMAAGGCDHRDTAEWQAEHVPPVVDAPIPTPAPIPVHRKRLPVSDTAAPAPQLAPEGITPAPAPATTATVQQPPASDPAAQLMALASQKDVSPMALVAGVVALGAGSTVIWKKLSEHLQSKREAEKEKADQDHELRKMELEQRSKQGEDQHKACGVARAALEAQVAALAAESKAATEHLRAVQASIAQVSEALSKLSENVRAAETRAEADREALSKRITKAETLLKRKPAATKG